MGKSHTGTLRPQKGQSLLTLVDDYVSVDIETTGLDPQYDVILELAAVRVLNGQITDKFQSLVKPEWPIPAYITELTGISDLMVANAPPIEDVLPKFLAFVGSSTIIAHNANFDINFIYDFAEALNLPAFSNNFIDTMRLSRRAYPQWANHKLQTLIRELDVSQTVEHRALSDCIQTSQCFEIMKAHIRENDIDLSPNRRSYNCSAKDISAQTTDFDPDSPLYQKTFVFTGALDRMTRREAMQQVVNAGGLCGDGVTKETDFLVLGNNDYCTTIKDGKSSKQKKAEKMKCEGFDIEIISENVFYDMLDETFCDAQESENSPISHILTEDQIFSLIRPTLISVIEGNNAPVDSLRLNQGKQCSSVLYASSVLCYLRFRGDDYFIEIPSPTPGETAHIPVTQRDALSAVADQIAARLDRLIDQYPSQFDCCSRFEQCSDALRCIHPDPAMAIGCRYRKNLKAGKVFYGKNATGGKK